ncbi:hypothetical protein COCON_G00064060 [Conger conger]|uniref:Uncharacterized protein n=1 Tax=Conger conger TaxID=82655 RepID=A0A9Q1DS09_CONCO|nr:hypothetical protein COCON_G00064060 [Conger conger]
MCMLVFRVGLPIWRALWRQETPSCSHKMLFRAPESALGARKHGSSEHFVHQWRHLTHYLQPLTSISNWPRKTRKPRNWKAWEHEQTRSE